MGSLLLLIRKRLSAYNKDFLTLVESLKKEYDDLSRFVNELINESNNICFVNSK